jgi:membrane-anchored glycerophosphoryl diester phosphodiesterase (GDPDase)
MEVSQLVWFGLVAAIVFVPVAIYVGVRIGFFGPYLIIDRDFGPLEAIQESWDLTTGHFWGLLGVTLLLGLMASAAYAAAVVPLLFVLPLTGLVRSAGYLLAGGTRPPMKKPERA